MRRNPPVPDNKLELVVDFVSRLMESEMVRLQKTIDTIVERNNDLNFTSNNRFRHNGLVWQHSTLDGKELPTPLDSTLEPLADTLSSQWNTAQADKKRIVQCIRLVVTHAETLEDWRNLLPDEFSQYFIKHIPRTRQQSEVWKLTEAQKRDYASVLLLVKKYYGLTLFN